MITNSITYSGDTTHISFGDQLPFIIYLLQGQAGTILSPACAKRINAIYAYLFCQQNTGLRPQTSYQEEVRKNF
jgi:hypothetical protein